MNEYIVGLDNGGTANNTVGKSFGSENWLGEIAEISYEEPPIWFVRHLDREYAVALEVYKESTANTVEVVDALMARIDEIRDELAARNIVLEDGAGGTRWKVVG